jgi:thiosulfate/3-mercaptopyruvate sulfurtransferase
MTHSGSPLVSTDWLASRIGAPDLVVLDGSWYLPAMRRDPRAEYLSGHLPGAVFFDIDEISDHSTPLPHMLPTAAAFAQAMERLGVGDRMTAVVYDGAGLFSAARVWWMLRIFGMKDVRLLDGGLPRWKAEGRPLEPGASSRSPARFDARLDATAAAALADVRAALADGSAQVVDARAAARFRGEAPEPRPGLPSGHMAGALNLPMTDIVADGRLLPPAELERAFRKSGLDPDRPTITSCGSGVSAAIINLAFAVTGRPQPRLYDGSWTEWASSGMPVATG